MISQKDAQTPSGEKNICLSFLLRVLLSPPTDQVRNSYQLCNNGTLRVMYANGMGISFHTEPHILAGSVSPTIGRRNITLPTDNGLNSIEWRLRKEQTKGKITVFGRKLRVSLNCFPNATLLSLCRIIESFLIKRTTFFFHSIFPSGSRPQPSLHRL